MIDRDEVTSSSNIRAHKRTHMRGFGYAALGCFLAATMPSAAMGQRGKERPIPQEDSVQAEQLLDCDRQAANETAQVSNLTPIAPISVLSPILLLNDINRRRQEEANQPKLLEQIELERQQCRNNVVAVAARRAQEVRDEKSDAARGYQMISFETFTLDAKSMVASQARISIRGSYVPDGNMEWLFPGQVEAIQARNSPTAGSNIARIPLLTEDASRDYRKYLLRCKSMPGADQTGCLTTIIGHVSVCSITSGLGVSRDAPCIVVENGR
jgi:hypothetical protein